jgi:type IV secretion system protein VirD4
MRWLRSERQIWADKGGRVLLQPQPTLLSFDARSRELYGKALPRGVLLPRLDRDRERINFWMSPEELLKMQYRDGQLILGKLGETWLGHLDDRPMVTIAGSRAGKTSTVLEPNLYLYPGSMLVMDPKGELAKTARFRRAMGHNVYVLDPFGQSGEESACFNPLAELDPENPSIIDDVGSIASALVPDDGDARSKHWDESARTLLMALMLLTLTFPEHLRHLVTVRELLCLTFRPLAEAAREVASKLADANPQEKKSYFDQSSVAMDALFGRLVAMGPRFGGIAAALGNRLRQMAPIERSGVFSTAATHTDFLDSLPLRAVLRHSDFSLKALRADKPATIFMCLPVARMERHSRWMRIVVQLACTTLETMGIYPRTRQPIIFLMEEFAQLGYMPLMESGAAYFPGFGVKLWAILQDITQLRRHYPRSWETFLGNSGLVQLFANGDEETLRYAERRLGKLITPFELRTAFSRERFSQLLLMQGKPPAASLRLDHTDIDRLRARAEDTI